MRTHQTKYACIILNCQCTQTPTPTHSHTPTHACTHTHLHAYSQAHTQHTHTYTHTHRHTHTTHTHTSLKLEITPFMDVKLSSTRECNQHAKDAEFDSWSRDNGDYQSKDTFAVLWIPSGDHSKNDTHEETNVYR